LPNGALSQRVEMEGFVRLDLAGPRHLRNAAAIDNIVVPKISSVPLGQSMCRPKSAGPGRSMLQRGEVFRALPHARLERTTACRQCFCIATQQVAIANHDSNMVFRLCTAQIDIASTQDDTFAASDLGRRTLGSLASVRMSLWIDNNHWRKP
jgi:hypothetical protein